ncbi:MAG: IclR family transcriptional regulator [Acidimicrobiales bacterium]
MAPESSQTLDRGLHLLEVLADDSRGVSVTDLAARLGASRPSVYRMLASLQRHHLVWRSGDGLVRLGPGILALARAATPILRDVATPLLRRLAEEVGATAHLTVADAGAGEAVAVAVVEPSGTAIHVAYRVGSRHPLDRGAGGRAILMARHGANGGFVVSRGELESGATGIAAAVHGVAGLDASVGIVTIGDALDVAAAGTKVVAAAKALATTLLITPAEDRQRPRT